MRLQVSGFGQRAGRWRFLRSAGLALALVGVLAAFVPASGLAATVKSPPDGVHVRQDETVLFDWAWSTGEYASYVLFSRTPTPVSWAHGPQVIWRGDLSGGPLLTSHLALWPAYGALAQANPSGPPTIWSGTIYWRLCNYTIEGEDDVCYLDKEIRSLTIDLPQPLTTKTAEAVIAGPWKKYIRPQVALAMVRRAGDSVYLPSWLPAKFRRAGGWQGHPDTGEPSDVLTVGFDNIDANTPQDMLVSWIVHRLGHYDCSATYPDATHQLRIGTTTLRYGQTTFDREANICFANGLAVSVFDVTNTMPLAILIRIDLLPSRVDGLGREFL